MVYIVDGNHVTGEAILRETEANELLETFNARSATNLVVMPIKSKTNSERLLKIDGKWLVYTNSTPRPKTEFPLGGLYMIRPTIRYRPDFYVGGGTV